MRLSATVLSLGAISVLSAGLTTALAEEKAEKKAPAPAPAAPASAPAPAGGGPAAADMPTFRGPDRTGKSAATGLLKDWPQGGPKLLWSFENAGLGYSGPAVVAGKLYTLGFRDDKETVIALDAKTGKELWATAIGEAKSSPNYNEGWGGGPRSNPTVDGDALYVLGVYGTLARLSAADGKIAWTKSLVKDFGGSIPGWGFAESPTVDGDKLVVTPGGKGGTVAALKKDTGETVWRSADWKDRCGYASLVIAEIGGVKQYVQMTGESAAGVAAADGKLLWRYERKRRTAAIPCPTVSGDFVFTTSGYGEGCDLYKITAQAGSFAVEQVYSNKNMTNHHGGVVLHEGKVYGFSDGKGWVCLDLKSGEMTWNQKDKLGKGSVVYADGRLYCYDEHRGTVLLLEPSPAGWKDHGRLELPKKSDKRSKSGGFWTHPVIADGKLYVRDQELMFCFDITGG
jgi:outer membrane protein assembly factor BamB